MFNKKMKKIVHVEGMSCQHCAERIEKELKKIENVGKVKVSLKNKQVVMTSASEISDQLIIESIENLGYRVTGISNN